jgi:hypothetical protein
MQFRIRFSIRTGGTFFRGETRRVFLTINTTLPLPTFHPIHNILNAHAGFPEVKLDAERGSIAKTTDLDGLAARIENPQSALLNPQSESIWNSTDAAGARVNICFKA